MSAPSRTFRVTYGTDTPENDVVPEYAYVNDVRKNLDSTSPILEWRCTGAGNPGTWVAWYGGMGAIETLNVVYANGTTSTHQTMVLTDADGGGIVVDARDSGYTGTNSFTVQGDGGTDIVVSRANAWMGIGATATSPLTIGVVDGSSNSINFNMAGDQYIAKSQGNLHIAMTGIRDFVVTQGGYDKIRVEHGASTANGVIVFNRTGSYDGTFAHWSTGETIITQGAFDLGGSFESVLHLIGGTLTNMATGAHPDVFFDLSHTVTREVGDYTSGGAFYILPPTWAYNSASVVTYGGTIWVAGPPVAGTNGTIINPWSIYVETGDIGILDGRLRVTGGSAQAPAITFMQSPASGDGYAGGNYENTGLFMDPNYLHQISVSTHGGVATRFDTSGVMTDYLQATAILGGAADGRDDTYPLSIFGGASTTLRGLTVGVTGTFIATSGTQSGTYWNYTGAAGAFAPTSGSAAWRALDLAYEINQTGGANGAVRGLNIAFVRTAIGGTHLPLSVSATSGGTGTGNIFRVNDANDGTATITIGDAATGFSAWSGINFATNARTASILLDDSSSYLWITTSGIQFGNYAGSLGTWDGTGLLVTDLAGSGTRMVTASSTGLLDTATIPTSAPSLTGPAVMWTNGSGTYSVDTTNFVWDSTNHTLQVGAGSATHPSVVPTGDLNSGWYSYAADVIAISAGGVAAVRAATVSTSRYFYVGETGTGLTGFAGLIFESNARTGMIYLDNSVGNVLISTAPFYVPNGTAAAPSLALTNSTGTGLYRYAADVLGIAAGGLFVARAFGDSTSRTVTIGEQSTGITAGSAIYFETNVRQGYVYMGNDSYLSLGAAGVKFGSTSGTLGTWDSGGLIVADLAGTGTRNVTCSSTGLLQAAAIDTVQNFPIVFHGYTSVMGGAGLTSIDLTASSATALDFATNNKPIKMWPGFTGTHIRVQLYADAGFTGSGPYIVQYRKNGGSWTTLFTLTNPTATDVDSGSVSATFTANSDYYELSVNDQGAVSGAVYLAGNFMFMP